MLAGDCIRQIPHGRLTRVNVKQGTSLMGESFERGPLQSFLTQEALYYSPTDQRHAQELIFHSRSWKHDENIAHDISESNRSCRRSRQAKVSVLFWMRSDLVLQGATNLHRAGTFLAREGGKERHSAHKIDKKMQYPAA